MKLDLESEWAPVHRAWGVVPLVVGLASLLGGSLLLGKVGWTFAFPFLVALMVGLASLGYGLALLWGRSGTTLDRDSATVSHWWGLPAPIWRRVAALPSVSEVMLTCSPEHLTNRKTYWRIAIVLPGPPPVTLWVKRVFAGRRHIGSLTYDIHLSERERGEIIAHVQGLARQVATFLGVPVNDQVPPEI